MNFIAPFIFGVAVAEAVGKKVIDPNAIIIIVVIAVTLSAAVSALIHFLLVQLLQAHLVIHET